MLVFLFHLFRSIILRGNNFVSLLFTMVISITLPS